MLYFIAIRWSHKYVVLDCPAEMAKEIVVSHVRDVTLGKRTYHYLLSGLVSAAPCLFYKTDDDEKFLLNF